MKRAYYIFIAQVFIIAWTFYGCEIETAAPNKYKELIIASDYLNSADTVIFKNFTKRTSIKVKIINHKPSKLIGIFRSKKYNSGIDIILLKSMTDVLDFNKKNIFHPLKQNIHYQSDHANYSSEKFNYIGIGYDPYVIAVAENQPNGLRMYNDLTRHHFETNLTQRELIPMFAPILSKKNRADANNWVKKFFDHSKQDSLFTDSLRRTLPILTNYSTCYNKETRPIFKNKRIVFPNTKSTGTFYNLRTICIAKQAENYDESLTFINYFLTNKNNQAINSKLNTLSIHSNEIGFRKYYMNSEKMSQYFLTIERLLHKLEN